MSEANDISQPAHEAAEVTDFEAIADEVTESDELDQGDSDHSSEDAALDQTAAIDAAQKAGAITKKEAQVLKKKLTIKVDGVESEEEIDFSNEEELKKMLQRSKAYDKRGKEYATLKSQTDMLLKMLQEDPEGLLEKLGKNVDEIAEKRLSRKVEEMKKSPEQIEREKMEKELEELREEKKRIQQEKDKAEQEKLRNMAAQEIEADIADALGSVKSILPKNNPIVLQRIASAMLLAMQNGYPQVKAKDVVPMVEKQWKQELNEFFSVSSEEALEALVGKTNLDKYRKTKVQSKTKAQTTTAKQVTKDSGAKKTEEAKPEVKYKMSDIFNYRK
jgi:hypothetical protein